MSILYGTFPWAFETPGGGEIQLLKYEEYGKQAGLDIQRFDPWQNQIKVDDEDKPSGFHYFSCMGGSIPICNYIKSQGIPLIISSSLWLTEQDLHLYPIAEITHQLNLADRIVTNGDIESDQISSLLNIDRSRFVTIRNACDPQFLDPVSETLFRDHFSIDNSFVLCIGNIEPRKNQLNLIKAIQDTDLNLVLIGHVRDEAYAQQCWDQAGSSTKYLGPIDHENPLLKSALVSSSLFCLPSTLETPGLAALEAGATGTPLIVTRHGSTKEYFHDFADYCDHDDVQGLRELILNRTKNPDYARSQALRTHIENNLTWPKVINELKSLYQNEFHL